MSYRIRVTPYEADETDEPRYEYFDDYGTCRPPCDRLVQEDGATCYVEVSCPHSNHGWQPVVGAGECLTCLTSIDVFRDRYGERVCGEVRHYYLAKRIWDDLRGASLDLTDGCEDSGVSLDLVYDQDEWSTIVLRYKRVPIRYGNVFALHLSHWCDGEVGGSGGWLLLVDQLVEPEISKVMAAIESGVERETRRWKENQRRIVAAIIAKEPLEALKREKERIEKSLDGFEGEQRFWRLQEGRY